MKKNSSVFKFFVFSILACMIFAGCVSLRAKNLIEAGDEISAVEILAKRLTSKSTDKDSAELFVSIYPQVVEKRLPYSSISSIKSEYLGKYGTSDTAAVKACIKELSDGQLLIHHPVINNVIIHGEANIKKLSELVRVQKAVAPMPSTIGNQKKKNGRLYEVKKYTEDFSGDYEIAIKEMGQFYYLLAETFFPGNTINQKKEIIEFYKKAETYLPGNSVIAVRFQQLYYEIAMLLRKNAVTKAQLEEVIFYLNLAKDYSDAKQQIIYVKYDLAVIYRNEHTRYSYEKAGQLFTEVGNYKDAPVEAALYAFYVKLRGLPRSTSNGWISLNAGNAVPFSMNSFVNSSDAYYSNLTVSGKSSILNVYSKNYESVIFPGAIIEGESIPRQKFVLFTAGSRNPVDFKITSGNYNVEGNGVITNSANGGQSSKEVRNALRNAVSKSYGSNGGQTPSLSYDCFKINSKEELDIGMGMGADCSDLIFAGNFADLGDDRSCTLVAVSQIYYSAQIDQPLLPVDFFSKSGNMISAASLKSISPYYVSNVDYGRKGYFVISSKLSSEEIISDLRRCIPSQSRTYRYSDLRLDSAIISKWRQNATLITAVTNSERIYSIVDLSGLFTWIQQGYDIRTPVSDLPAVSFTLKNLYSNEYAVLSQSAQITVRNPTPVKPQPEPIIPAPVKPTPVKPEPKPVVPEPVPVNPTPVVPQPEPVTPVPVDPVPVTPEPEPVTPQPDPVPVNPPSTSSPSDMYSNKYTSLVFVGKDGYYQCSKITEADEWIYEIPADEILFCHASWNSAEYQAVYVNGINMIKDETVYSFRDVAGNNISLDIIDAKGNRSHHLLKVIKK